MFLPKKNIGFQIYRETEGERNNLQSDHVIFACHINLLLGHLAEMLKLITTHIDLLNYKPRFTIFVHRVQH